MISSLKARWEHAFQIKDSRGALTPLALKQHGLVLAHSSSVLSAWDLVTGVSRYEHKTQSIVCGLAVTHDQTRVAFMDGFEVGASTVVIIDAATGDVAHRIACEGKPTNLVAISRGFAWLESRADAPESLAVADAASGRVASFALPPGKTNYVYGDGGERVYLVRYATPTPVIACSTTAVVWQYEAGPGPAVCSLIAIGGTHVVADRAGDGRGAYAALDATTGALAWEKPVPRDTYAVLDGGDLLVITHDQAKFERWNLATGKLAGVTKLPASFRGSLLTIAVSGGMLWAQCDEERAPLQAFELATGKLAAQGSIKWSRGPAIAVTPKVVVVQEVASVGGIVATVRAYANPFSA